MKHVSFDGSLPETWIIVVTRVVLQGSKWESIFCKGEPYAVHEKSWEYMRKPESAVFPILSSCCSDFPDLLYHYFNIQSSRGFPSVKENYSMDKMPEDWKYPPKPTDGCPASTQTLPDTFLKQHTQVRRSFFKDNDNTWDVFPLTINVFQSPPPHFWPTVIACRKMKHCNTISLFGKPQMEPF